MENKRVFTHYYKNDDIEYRWRTLIQIGDSWKECGTIFMKNPGSSTYCDKTPSPITNGDLLDNLRNFDYEDVTYPREWYEFSVDNTMAYVIKLFEEYHRKPLNGVIQIFNLFNIRGANLDEAIKKCNGDILTNLAYTSDDDIKHIISPVYLGWGDLWTNIKFRDNAKKIFDEVRKKTSYLCDGIQNNKYYHPQYLMNYGKNKLDCNITLTRFIKNEIHPKELDSFIATACKSPINIVHVIELLTSCEEFELSKIENKAERYNLSNNLMIQITKTGKGYLAIRHKKFNTPYPNSKYEFTDQYRDFFRKQGWNCDDNVWIAKKFIRDFGNDENEIIKNIISEINDIVKFLTE